MSPIASRLYVNVPLTVVLYIDLTFSFQVFLSSNLLSISKYHYFKSVKCDRILCDQMSSIDKASLPPRNRFLSLLSLNNAVWALVVLGFIVFRFTFLHDLHPIDQSSNNCPQAAVLIPAKNGKIWTKLNDKIDSAAFKQTAIDRLAGAVRIPWASLPLEALSAD